jgi:hypothetical protein
MDAVLAFWRGMLGFELRQPPPFSTTPPMTDLLGVPEKSEFRTVSGTFPAVRRVSS